ncbi:putative leader peptide [Streptomyces sp. BF23-19]|uniref:putative leader peptide n=1 Tax=unclassified Streptomyces TaxID=2593676 RepID=UPI0034E3A336
MKDDAGRGPTRGSAGGRTLRQGAREAGEFARPARGGYRRRLSYLTSRKVLTRARRTPHHVGMPPSQPLLVRRRHVDFRRVASAVCRPV